MVLRKLKPILVVWVVIFCGCEQPGALTDSQRRELLQQVDAEDLVDYCELLERLYDDPAKRARISAQKRSPMIGGHSCLTVKPFTSNRLRVVSVAT